VPVWLLIPLAALITCVPELLHGPSCGHDFVFHIQGWLDAAAQLRHAHFPHWSTTAAWHAGEPRFTFYPPFSWLLGALLTTLLPPDAVPVAFTFLALTGAGLAMYRLARSLTPSRPAATFAACVYLANPYLLFNAYERTAFAELLAAAFFPLLLAAALRRRLSVPAIALPLAALWLTNAPSGIMGTYALAFLILCRVVLETDRWPLLRDSAIAGALGLGLPGFYLLPVFAERHLIQITMAEIPAMSPAGNFLFGHLGDAAHDQVLHTASLIAVTLLGATIAALLAAGWRARTRLATAPDGGATWPSVQLLGALALVIAILLTPLSAVLWRVLPEVALLQFPWRLLSLLGCICGAALALALPRSPALWMPLGGLVLAALLTAPESSLYRQACEINDPPHRVAELLRSGHGFQPTDEYTPTKADNDPLRFDSPGWWLVPPSQPNDPAPGTIPNPAEQNPDADLRPPDNETVSAEAPHHLELQLPGPRTLVLNLRDWPAWRISRNGVPLQGRIGRDDGLLAIPLPPGPSTIEVHWQSPPEFLAGGLLSLVSAAALLALARRKLGDAKQAPA
jgi:hypothetical protein